MVILREDSNYGNGDTTGGIATNNGDPSRGSNSKSQGESYPNLALLLPLRGSSW